MPKFLDVHPTKGFDELTLKKAMSEPPDEFGVTAENFLYNIEADRLYCILNAPSKEAIDHCKFQLNYNNIQLTASFLTKKQHRRINK